ATELETVVARKRLRELEDGKVATRSKSKGRHYDGCTVVQRRALVFRSRREISLDYPCAFYPKMPLHCGHVIVRPDELAIAVQTKASPKISFEQGPAQLERGEWHHRMAEILCECVGRRTCRERRVIAAFVGGRVGRKA